MRNHIIFPTRFINFEISTFHYSRLMEWLPAPSGVEARPHGKIAVSYILEQRFLGWKQHMRIGLVKRAVFRAVKGHIRFDVPAAGVDGPIFTIDEIWRKHCPMELWPRIPTAHARKDFMPALGRYARRLYESDLLYPETVLGAALFLNRNLKTGRFAKYETIMEKAAYVYASAMDVAQSGEWDRLRGEALKEARRRAAAASCEVRRQKAWRRRVEVAELLDRCITDPREISELLDTPLRTIQRDIFCIRQDPDRYRLF